MLTMTRGAVATARLSPRTIALFATLAALAFGTVPVHAASVLFSVPAENAMPSPFLSVPFPSDLYFDQGQPGDGDGTLLNTGSNVGISVVATNANFSPAVERGLDTLTGWGVSTGCHLAVPSR